MLKCLQCGTPLEQDFGITACLNCGAVMMIDMDGQVQLAEDEPASEEPVFSFEAPSEPESQPTEKSDFAISGGDSSSETPVDFSAPALFDWGSSSSAEEVPAEEPLIEEPREPFMADPFANAEGAPQMPTDFEAIHDASESAEPVVNNFINFSEESSAEHSFDPVNPQEDPLMVQGEVASDPETAAPVIADDNWFDRDFSAQPEPAAAASTPAKSAGDFSDVSDFANQNTDLGALQFELTIAGIDHADLRADVLEVLAEPRLGFVIRDLSLQIQDGFLVLGGLNAARASLVVSRLQHLDVRLQWRQKVYET